MQLLGIKPQLVHKLGKEAVSIPFTQNEGLRNVFIDRFKNANGLFLDESSEQNYYTFIIGENGTGKTGILDFISNYYVDALPREDRLHYLNNEGCHEEPNIVYISSYLNKEIRDRSNLTTLNPHKHSCTMQFLYFLLRTENRQLKKLEEKIGRKFVKVRMRSGIRRYAHDFFGCIADRSESLTREEAEATLAYQAWSGSEANLKLDHENFKRELQIAIWAHDLNEQGIDLEAIVMNPVTGQEYPIGWASGGEKLIVKLFGYFSRCYNETKGGYLFLFDEPENALHPKWQLDYPNLLKEIAEDIYGIKRSHFILATHSPLMVKGSSKLDYSNIISLSRDPRGELVVENIQSNDINRFSIDNLLLDTFQVRYLDEKKEKELEDKIRGYAAKYRQQCLDGAISHIDNSYTIKGEIQEAYENLIKRQNNEVCREDPRRH